MRNHAPRLSPIRCRCVLDVDVDLVLRRELTVGNGHVEEQVLSSLERRISKKRIIQRLDIRGYRICRRARVVLSPVIHRRRILSRSFFEARLPPAHIIRITIFLIILS